MAEETVGRGLEDVVVAESDICFIDGREGRLLFRGYNVADLAREATYEEVVYLLWHGRLPNAGERDELAAAIAAEATVPAEIMAFLKGVPKTGTPMEVLRTAVSMLSLSDPAGNGTEEAATHHAALRLLAKAPTIVAAYHRLREGHEPIAPQSGRGLAWNFLHMLTGNEPDDDVARMFDVCLVLHADHEFNASTFAARVTAATLSDMYSSITSAIGALKGPLHGGANEQVMRMLLEIGTVENARPWIHAALAEKRKISGFGHRVYRTEDPRATVLRGFSERMGHKTGNATFYDMSRVIEKAVMDEKGLFPNVDFFSGSTYYAMGIPLDIFTPIFAISRMAGWTTHVFEQYAHNRLIRPRAKYTGSEGETWVPITQR